MNEQSDFNKIDSQTEAVIKLAQQLAVNNNTVSSAMRLISDNLEEVVSMEERIENKFDNSMKEIKDHAINWDLKTCEQVKDLIKKIEETGLLKFLSFTKKILTAAIITVIVSGLIYAGKTIINVFHILQKLGSGG